MYLSSELEIDLLRMRNNQLSSENELLRRKLAYHAKRHGGYKRAWLALKVAGGNRLGRWVLRRLGMEE